MNSKATFLTCVILFLAVKADRELFTKFQVEHGKTYDSLEEHEYRYKIFANNLKIINDHNEKFHAGLLSWELGTNQFSDLTAAEFRKYLGTFPLANLTQKSTLTYQPPLDASPPASIDWRSKGAVTGVKNQESCGGCWSFSATGTTESHYFIKTGKLISLSEQQLLDCAVYNSGYSCNGCNGGVVQSALDYVRDHGLETEATYPFIERQSGKCSMVSSKVVVKTKGYTDVAVNNENDLKNAVGLKGPVSVALNADKFQFYKSGIFADTSCSNEVDHGVLAVGYGSQSGTNYWIIKNSWGTSFGENGYIRIKMGHNICGLARQACFPYF